MILCIIIVFKWHHKLYIYICVCVYFYSKVTFYLLCKLHIYFLNRFLLSIVFIYGVFVRLEIPLVAQMVKNLPAMQETWIQPLGQKIPWRRASQPTPVFLPGEFHGQRSLMGYPSMGLQRVRHGWVTNMTLVRLTEIFFT